MDQFQLLPSPPRADPRGFVYFFSWDYKFPAPEPPEITNSPPKGQRKSNQQLNRHLLEIIIDHNSRDKKSSVPLNTAFFSKKAFNFARPCFQANRRKK